MLAPRHRLRSRVIPEPPAEEAPRNRLTKNPAPGRSRWHAWADLLWRVFEVDAVGMARARYPDDKADSAILALTFDISCDVVSGEPDGVAEACEDDNDEVVWEVVYRGDDDLDVLYMSYSWAFGR